MTKTQRRWVTYRETTLRNTTGNPPSVARRYLTDEGSFSDDVAEARVFGTQREALATLKTLHPLGRIAGVRIGATRV